MRWDKLSILINRLSPKQDEFGYICVADFVTGIVALRHYHSVLPAITGSNSSNSRVCSPHLLL